MKTVKEVIKEGTESLIQRQYSQPLLEAQLLLAFVLDVSKQYLYFNLEQSVTPTEHHIFRELLHIRNQGYPLQYILRNQEFMGLDFYIEEGVLVPRPDTESVVERLIEEIKGLNWDQKRIRILDIGSGSGAIGCSLAYYLPKSTVIGMDISPIALKISTINGSRLGLNNYHIIEQDIFADDGFMDKFDVIVSNPPYIANSHIMTLQTEVSTYEPLMALAGGEDGLDFYRQILKRLKDFIKPEGLLAFEIGFDQRLAVVSLMKKAEMFQSIQVIQDLQGLDRGVLAFRMKEDSFRPFDN